MSSSKSSSILIGFSIACLAIAAFFGMRTRQLQVKLNQPVVQNQLTADEKFSESKIREWTDLLTQGQHREIIRDYDNFKSDRSPQVLQDLEKYVQIARRMHSLDQNVEPEVIEKTKIDTIEKFIVQSIQPSKVETDSLNFALEKAELQLEMLKKQLKNNSSGAYLTFKTTKGNALHYVGETKGGKANGFGIAILDSGSRYEGDWANNQRHGQGTFYWIDGAKYEGEYENDRRQGIGTYYWPNGEKYIGEWSEDMRNGKGIFYDEKGEIKASGTWLEDKLHKVEKGR